MSYEIAATGLNAVNEQLDGISNNIANSGTVGYKSMTTQFSAMYAGTQAMGVSVAGSAQSISTGGSMVSTGAAFAGLSSRFSPRRTGAAAEGG